MHGVDSLAPQEAGQAQLLEHELGPRAAVVHGAELDAVALALEGGQQLTRVAPPPSRPRIGGVAGVEGHGRHGLEAYASDGAGDSRPVSRETPRPVSRETPRPLSRLAYVAGTYPELEETFVTGELRELVRLGEPPPLVFAVIRGSGPLAGAPAAHSYVVELPKARQLGALAVLLLRRPRRTLRALLSPRRRFGGRPRDMAALAPMALAVDGARHIHAHFCGRPTDVAARLSQLTGVPFSFTAHAHDLFVEWERMEEKLRAARFAVTVCEYNRRYVRERIPWAEPRMVVCGVDVERFRRASPYLPDGPVVAVGRLVEQKGFEHLLRAAALVRGRIPEVVVAGRGPLRERLERLATELDAPVRFLGDVPHDRIRELYESASMAVLPCVVASDGNRDSMPLAVKEAMAMELPVVVSREVGLPELVDESRGALVPPADSEALAAALAELYGLPAPQREAMGRAGRHFVEEHCNLATETARLREMFGP